MSTPIPFAFRPASTSRTWSARPDTRQSTSRLQTGRPQTARPQTAASTRHEASYVVAIIEGRGISREVGMCAFDKDTGKVMLVQVADCQTYVKTLHQMHLHTPNLILVPDTNGFIAASSKRQSTTSPLLQYIEEEFPGVPIEPVPRKYWNDGSGLQFIHHLCVEDEERAGTIMASSKKHYALSAASALFKHSESRLNLQYAQCSLKIRYVPVEGTMMIDPETARNLELVGSMAGKKSIHSLFGTVNHTYTAMAARLLRVNILSPITSQNAIDARLDVVEELVQTEDKFTNVRDALKSLNKMDFDKLIASLAASDARPSGNNAKVAALRVSQMLSLRNLVWNLPILKKVLDGSCSQLLRIIHKMISDERIAKIKTLVCASLNEETSSAKGGIAAVNARVYAVKANCNRLLDVARETYKENVGDIYQLNRDMSEKHELSMTLVYQESGFMFAVKKTDLEGELPKGFLNPVMQKGRWLFSSLNLMKMNARMKDALDESLILSEKIIQELVSGILEDVGALYKASEAVALLDMLWSFAHTSIMRNYVRPEFTGTLAIKAGRHPIFEGLQSAGTLVPNDVYCDDASCFQMVQGPNMSGKSTYLRQIGLLAVLAMCGCFVPAEYASFRIHDALLTRLSNDDDMEKSLSTFANEMAASAMIISLATKDTLVLIDELGRGTSPREGMGISHAIAESLIDTKAFVFFATHFHELSTTLSRKPTVINLHLSVQKARQTTSNFGMTFQYKIVDGVPDNMNHYGLELARLADLPPNVLSEGRRVTVILAEQEKRQKDNSKTSKIATRRAALITLRSQLTQALDHSALSEEDLIAYISRFQREISTVLEQAM